MATLGTKLSRLRQKKGYSQQELADKLNISQPAYRKYEMDEAKPGIDAVAKLCSLYGIELSELMDDMSTFSITNNECTIQNIGNPNSNFYAESPDLIKGVLKNQEAITGLLNAQNQLIETLIKKIQQ